MQLNCGTPRNQIIIPPLKITLCVCVCVCVCVYVLSHFSHVQLFVTLWTIAHQAPLKLPDPGIKLVFLMSPTLAGRFFATSATWEAQKKSHCREIFSRMERCSAISLSSLILNQSMKLAKYFMLVTASWACKMHHFLYHIKAYGLNSKNWFISKEADCFLLDQQ